MWKLRRPLFSEEELSRAVEAAGESLAVVEMASAVRAGRGDLVAFRGTAGEDGLALYELAYRVFRKRGGRLSEPYEFEDNSSLVIIAQGRRWPARGSRPRTGCQVTFYYSAEEIPASLAPLLARVDRVSVDAETVLRATERKARIALRCAIARFVEWFRICLRNV